MRHKTSNSGKDEAGFVALVIIVLLVLGALLYFLYNMRRASETEGKQFVLSSTTSNFSIQWWRLIGA